MPKRSAPGGTARDSADGRAHVRPHVLSTCFPTPHYACRRGNEPHCGHEHTSQPCVTWRPIDAGIEAQSRWPPNVYFLPTLVVAVLVVDDEFLAEEDVGQGDDRHRRSARPDARAHEVQSIVSP